MSMLEVKNAHKSFGQNHVLKGIDFTLEKGEVLSIIGSSGSGKTTLLRCLNFLETPDSMQIYLNNELLYDAERDSALSEEEKRVKRLHFGLVFQNFNLFPQYDVLENLCLAPFLQAKSRPDFKENKKEIRAGIEEKAVKILADVGLTEKIHFYPGKLSGGQQQRVAIARALMLEPDILFFDEPTSALDPELTAEVLNVLRELSRKDTTMIIVTHEMAFAREISDKVLFLDKGIAAAFGTSKEVFEMSGNDRLKTFISGYTGVQNTL